MIKSILIIIRENIKRFEEKDGEITEEIDPSVNVKPDKKK